MRLNLSVAGKVIASIPLDKEKWSSLDYVQAKRRLLTAVHAHIISAHAVQPVFYIEIASRMNNQSFLKASKRPRTILQASQ